MMSVPFYDPTYGALRAYLDGGRDTSDRPYGNNTRLLERDVRVIRADGSAGATVPAIAVRLHSTDVVTFLPDGRRIVNYGGWHSNTTEDRIRTAIGNRVKFAWTREGDRRVIVDGAPAAPSPYRPRLSSRAIPAPWRMDHPGDYPTWTVEGCSAGTVETFETSHNVRVRADGVRSTDYVVSRDPVRTYDRNPSVMVRRGLVVTRRTLQRAPRWEETRAVDPGATSHDIAVQCPHCAAHDVAVREYVAQYARWRDYCANVREHGGWQGWRDAATAEYRAVKDAQSAYDAWIDAWTVDLDGAVITPDGYACSRAVRGNRIRERRRARERARIARERAREQRETARIRALLQPLVQHYGRGATPDVIAAAVAAAGIGADRDAVAAAWIADSYVRRTPSPRVREGLQRGKDFSRAWDVRRAQRARRALEETLRAYTVEDMRRDLRAMNVDPDGYQLAWKRVGRGLRSRYGASATGHGGTEYLPGTRVDPDRWDPSPSCGHGLHVVDTLEGLEYWIEHGPTVIAVAVPAHETVDIPAQRKRKASHVYVLAVLVTS